MGGDVEAISGAQGLHREDSHSIAEHAPNIAIRYEVSSTMFDLDSHVSSVASADHVNKSSVLVCYTSVRNSRHGACSTVTQQTPSSLY
jgi:hypothetical protein